MDRWIDGWMDRQINGLIDEWIDDWMNRRMDGQMNG